MKRAGRELLSRRERAVVSQRVFIMLTRSSRAGECAVALVPVQQRMLKAARENDAATLQKLLGGSSDDSIAVRTLVNAPCLDNGNTLVQVLTCNKKNYAEALRALLSCGADCGPSVRNEEGWTVVHAAVYQNQFAALKLLLEMPAARRCLSVTDSKGMTPVHMAVRYRLLPLLKLLLGAGADLCISATVDERKPLHTAAALSYEACKLLLDAGALVNEQCLLGQSALHIAVQENKLQCTKLLLEHGPTLCSRITRGEPPLTWQNFASTRGLSKP
jgi:ankyrin repeat protein